MVHVSHTLGLMSVTVLLRVFYTDVVPRPICVCVCACVCVCVVFFVSFSFFLTITSTETTFIRYK